MQQQVIDRHATLANKLNSEAPCQTLTSLVHIKGCDAPLVCSREDLVSETQDISQGSTSQHISERLAQVRGWHCSGNMLRSVPVQA